MLAHNVKVLVFELDDATVFAVTVFQFVSSVPLVRVKVPVPILKASCSVHHPPTQSKVTAQANATLFIVIVFPVAIEEKVIVHV